MNKTYYASGTFELTGYLTGNAIIVKPQPPKEIDLIEKINIALAVLEIIDLISNWFMSTVFYLRKRLVLIFKHSLR